MLLLLLLSLCFVVVDCSSPSSGSGDNSAVLVTQFPFLLYDYTFPSKVSLPPQLSPYTNVTCFWSIYIDDNNDLISNGTQFDVHNGATFNVPVVVHQHAGHVQYRFFFVPGDVSWNVTRAFKAVPAWVTLIPPTVAIVVVVALREATAGLFFGVFVAATLIVANNFNPVMGLLESCAVLLVDAWCDRDNGEVVVFALLLGGWTALVRVSGGFHDVSHRLTHRISSMSSRVAQLTIIAMGIIIQLSGHLSIFLVGSSMLHLAQQTHVSPDKFAFLVDATAAPVASLSVVSSFTAVQTSYIEQEFNGISYTLMSPFEAFVLSIPSGFYQLNVLYICVWTALFNRELFWMIQPERTARATLPRPSHVPGDISDTSLLKDETSVDLANPPPPSSPQSQLDESNVAAAAAAHVVRPVDPFAPDPRYEKRWFNAVVPFLVMLCVTIIGVFLTGYFKCLDEGIPYPTMPELLGRSEAVHALLWGVVCATLLTYFMLLIQGRKFLDLMETWYAGCNSMLPAMLMLAMAWALSAAIQTMHFGTFIGGALSTGFPAGLLPTLVVIIAFIVSFASGTSFGTMGVIFPISIPAAYMIAPTDTHLMITTIAATIAGSNCGDHSSPVSDTTILSAMMAGIPNLQHTKTQIPYALMSLVVSILFGYLPVGFQLYNAWVANVLSCGVIGLVVFLCGPHVGNYVVREQKCTDQDNVPIIVHAWNWLTRNERVQSVLRCCRRQDYTTV